MESEELSLGLAVPTARLIADALAVPFAYMYCEDDKLAAFLLALHKLKPGARDRKVAELLVRVAVQFELLHYVGGVTVLGAVKSNLRRASLGGLPLSANAVS
jgi:hypothetical protein